MPPLQPYHRYVFDEEKRKFVGKFNEMYANEEQDGADPWHASDLTKLPKILHHALLSRRNWETILDYGCGKGAFTQLLKKENNRVVGVDLSESAIAKAKFAYGHLIDFYALQEEEWKKPDYDLVVCLEALSYMRDWRETLEYFSAHGNYLYASLYIPENPIGYVKSIADFCAAFSEFFTVDTEIIFNKQSVFLLGKSKKGK